MATSQMEYILQNMQKELEGQVEKVTKCRNEKGMLRTVVIRYSMSTLKIGEMGETSLQVDEIEI